MFLATELEVCSIADSGFLKTFSTLVKSTDSVLFEDLKFKISEGYEQKLSFPVSALFRLEV